MKRAWALGLAAAFAPVCPAYAAKAISFNVPAQPLDHALIALGQQAQISIGGIDARIGAASSNAVRGKMPVARALKIMLRNTGFAFVEIDARTIRIIRALPALASRSPKAEHGRASSPAPEPPSPDIIVTASKQLQGLDRYPGTATIARVGYAGLAETQATAAFVSRIPTLSSTNLGPGRNKLFVRGITDSSFNGPTQSTVGLYLGNLRLTYNAPEPDLRLYDIDRIEVIEGPQGTLYGAGTLGGIVRLMPNAPDLTGFHAFASVGASASRRGADGSDLGAMLNIPLVSDRVGLRLVGYRQIEGGYIDNATLGTKDTNRSLVRGGRASLLIRPGGGWAVDIGAVSQNIDTRDGQYAETDRAPYSHAANVAQPHDNDFRGGSIEFGKTWNGLNLISSTGFIRHDLSETFDATGFGGQPGVQVFRDNEKIHLITHETRLSRSSTDGGSWVAGVSFVRNVDRMGRSLGPLGGPPPPAALRNAKTEIAAFGEATRPVARDLFATIGARLVYASTIGELLGNAGSNFEPRGDHRRILPTAAISWKPSPGALAFARYQTGFRSGGIAITSGQANAAQRFASDEIHTGELGIRFGNSTGGSRSRLSGGASGFFTIWKDIQADLIDMNGLPFTANIGRGRVFGLEANASWRPYDNLTLDTSLFLNDSALVGPALGFEDINEHRLPNIARAGGRFDIGWERQLSANWLLRLNGIVRYTGRSSLGTAAPLILEQGEYAQFDLSANLGSGAWQISLDATNLSDAHGNSFSYGNPFKVSEGKQITPLRPRTFRLGLHVEF